MKDVPFEEHAMLATESRAKVLRQWNDYLLWGGLPESVSDASTGYIVPPGDPKALSNAITEFFAGDHAAEFKENIKADEWRFSWENMVMTIEDLYREVCL